MFKYRMMIVVFLVVVLLAGCTPGGPFITGSGNVVTREESLSGFDRVEAGGAFQVDIRQGEGFRVVLRVDDNVVQYLDVSTFGRTLHIGLKPGVWSFNNVTLQAEVTMPELAGLDLSGASHGTVTGFKSTKSLDLKLSGASSVQGDIETGDIRIELSGASSATLSGLGKNARIDASGASDANLADFPVADADVELSGASSATVNLSGRLDVQASGASHVYYIGHPTLGRMETSGASSVESK